MSRPLMPAEQARLLLQGCKRYKVSAGERIMIQLLSYQHQHIVGDFRGGTDYCYTQGWIEYADNRPLLTEKGYLAAHAETDSTGDVPPVR